MKEVRVCEAMKSPVGTLSEGTVLHQQDGGTKSRQVRVCTAKRSNESPSGAFKRRNGLAQRSGAMKAPVGLLSDGTVLRSKMEGPSPDKFRFGRKAI